MTISNPLRAGPLWAWTGAGILAVAIGATAQRPSGADWNLGDRDALRFVDVVRRTDTDDTLESLVAHERYAEAFGRALWELRLRLHTLGALHPATLCSLRRVGVVAHISDDDRLAGEIFDALLPALRDLPSSHAGELCEALMRRGRNARYLGDRERARQLYDEAELALQKVGPGPGRLSLESFLLHARADWTRRPDPERAIELYRSALRLRESASEVSSFTLANNHVWTGFTLAHAGRWSEARPHIAAAKSILAAIGISDHPLLGTLDGLEGEDLLLHGRGAEALARFTRQAAQVERTRTRFAPAIFRTISHSTAFDILAADALARGASEEAWELRERALGGLHADSAVLGRWPSDEPATFERARELSLRLLDATRQWEVSGAAWTAATAPLLLRRLEAKAALDEVMAAYLAAHPLPLPDLSRVRSLLDPETAMIGWLEPHVGNDTHPIFSQGWAYVLRRDEPVRWVRLWETRARSEKVFTDSRVGMSRLARAATWPERVLPDAQMLADLKERGRLYFDPLRPHLRGIRRLVVSGAIDMLAECFVGPDGRYVAEDFEFVHTPSAATFQVLSQSGAETAPRVPGSILAVGAPDATGRLPRLPFLQSEAASVSRLFPRAVRLDSPAGLKTRLEALARSGELAGFDVIHLAGHALSDPAPARSAIVFSGSSPAERLTVEDVALSWRIRARLVTFSACESARTGGGRGGEPLGFTSATFAAGGTNILSSLWPVDDRATSLLMSRFYENLTGASGPPMTPARALFEAKAALRTLTDPDGSRPFEHPAYWAAWALLGTGR